MNRRRNTATCILFSIVGVLTMAATPSLSSTPAEYSCEFAKALQVRKSDARLILREMFRHLDEDNMRNLDGILAPLPERFEAGEIVEVGDVGDLYVDHLIVMNSPDAGSVYFRLIYEKAGDEYFAAYATLDADANSALNKWPILMEPSPVRC